MLPDRSERFRAISSHSLVSLTYLLYFVRAEVSEAFLVPTPEPETGTSVRNQGHYVYLSRWLHEYLDVGNAMFMSNFVNRPCDP